jgi:hypothetical protein
MTSTMTPQDWAALSAAGQQGGTAYLEALAAQQQAALAGIPNAPGNTAAGAAGTSSQYALGADAIAQVQNAYPNLAWLLSVPDLGPLIVQWAQRGDSQTVVDAELQSTPFFRTSSDAVRKWIQEVESDPAQAQADMSAQTSAMNATLSSLGLKATPQQVQFLAQQSLAFGWTDQQIKDNINQAIVANPDGTFSFHYAGQIAGASPGGGTLGANVNSINAEAAKYLVPISASTAQSFASAMAGGTMDAASVTAYFQQQASSLYPSIAGAIKAGITPADYVTPYKEVAAQLLGVSPNSIDMMKPQYSRALSAPGPGGVPTAMSLYDFQQVLMKDPQYGYMNSVNAKDRASSIAQGLGEMFGKTPTGPAGSTAFSAAGAPRISGVPVN